MSLTMESESLIWTGKSIDDALVEIRTAYSSVRLGRWSPTDTQVERAVNKARQLLEHYRGNPRQCTAKEETCCYELLEIAGA